MLNYNNHHHRQHRYRSHHRRRFSRYILCNTLTHCYLIEHTSHCLDVYIVFEMRGVSSAYYTVPSYLRQRRRRQR